MQGKRLLCQPLITSIILHNTKSVVLEGNVQLREKVFVLNIIVMLSTEKSVSIKMTHFSCLISLNFILRFQNSRTLKKYLITKLSLF